MNNDYEQVDTVILDVGGVICTPSRMTQFVEWAVLNYGVDEASFRESVRQKRGELFREEITEDDFFESMTEMGIPLSADEIKLAYVSPNTPNPEMLALLSELKERGVVLAILSNSIPITTAKVREDLAGVFDVEIFSDEVGLRKPDPRIWEMALEKLGKNPEQCLYIDDKGKNLSVPSEMGMAVEEFASPEELRKVLRDKYHLVL